MSAAEWFETWFDTDYYHLLYSNRDKREARQFIDALLSYLNPQADSKFIDIACGKGRHAMQLAENLYKTTGVDLSENSILEAKKSESELLRFFVHDIREPLPGGKYDYALNLFTSFGYFDTMQEHTDALSNIYDALNPEGTFVFDYLNTSAVNCDSNNPVEVIYNGIQFITQKAIVGKHIVKSIRVIDGQEEYLFQEKVMAFKEPELIEMLNNIGFNILCKHGDYQLGPFETNKPRLIIIAQKNK